MKHQQLCQQLMGMAHRCESQDVLACSRASSESHLCPSAAGDSWPTQASESRGKLLRDKAKVDVAIR